MRILAIAGSLRARSTNRTVLEAASLLAPAGMEMRLFGGLGNLPLFNPDLDQDPLPAPVQALRAAVDEADGLLICSPEYARGVSAVLKNALEWLVSGPEFPDKPVAVINASQRSSDADGQLRLILRTMSAQLVEPASVTIPMLGRDLDAEGLAMDPALAPVLRRAIAEFAEAIDARRGNP
jgi:NAD(P)H-dependent FMN reductase